MPTLLPKLDVEDVVQVHLQMVYHVLLAIMEEQEKAMYIVLKVKRQEKEIEIYQFIILKNPIVIIIIIITIVRLMMAWKVLIVLLTIIA